MLNSVAKKRALSRGLTLRLTIFLRLSRLSIRSISGAVGALVAQSRSILLCISSDARFGHLFWRDKLGGEVDFLIESGQQVQTVEFKAGQTVVGDWFGALRKYEALRAEGAIASGSPGQLAPAPRPISVYGGSDSQTREVADICPWQHWPEKAIKLLQ